MKQTNTPILEVEQLSKAYQLHKGRVKTFREAAKDWFRRSDLLKTGDQDFWSLKDISFSLNPGESMGIIGQNGAGKSTLLRILAGLTAPTTGKISMRGSVAAVLEIGSGFHNELTGRENILFNGRLLGYSNKEIEQKLATIIEFSGIAPFIDTPVKYYSSGMFLRLAFSVAVHFERDIMLFDEVMAVGDMAFQARCYDKILELRRRGKSFLLVSHQMKDLAQFCDKIMVLEKGKIKTIAPVREALKQYSDLIFSTDNPTGALRSRQFDEWIAIKEAQVYQNGCVVDALNYQQPTELRLSFTCKKPVPSLHLGLSVSDMNQSLLFGDCSLYHLQHPLSLKPGSLYHIRWKMPARLLNAGLFYLNLHLINEQEQIIGRKLGVARFQMGPAGSLRMPALEELFSIRVPFEFEVETQ